MTALKAASDPTAQLLEILDITQVERHAFRGVSPKGGWGRVYGGQVLAQSLVAASRTVDVGRPIHSLHAYFLLAGDPAVPIEYEVEALRDGGSFSTRRVTALQNKVPIFSMLCSFQRNETGFSHAAPMPEAPPPESVATVAELCAMPDAQIPQNMRAYYKTERPLELRPVDTARYFGATGLEPRQRFWLKASRRLPDDPEIHSAILAYASDFAMIDTALIGHGKVMFDAGMQLASLDHALWIHRPVRADEWLLYVLESPAAGGGRGFARGTFYSQDGTLIASVAQEGLMRERSTAFVIK